MRASECDIVIVGVGGQGVILLSDVIGRAAVKAGKPVRGAETHGMAQRGGERRKPHPHRLQPGAHGGPRERRCSAGSRA